MNATSNPVPSPRRLQLVWSTEDTGMTLRIAFASDDRTRVNQHFGAAEGFAVYDIGTDRAQLAGVGEFPPETMDGNEDKLAAKIQFLHGCTAVFVLAIGASAIKQLMAAGVQPVRITGSDRIEDIVLYVQEGMRDGGVPWIDKALAGQRKDDARFARMADEGWEG